MSEPPSRPSSPGSALDTAGSSQVSIGFDDGFSAQTFSSGRERPRPLVQLASDKCVPHRDVCAVGLYCGAHDKFLLRVANGPGGGVSASRKGLFLPFVRMRASDSWRATAVRLVRMLLRTQKINSPEFVQTQFAAPLYLVDHLRVQWPKRAPHFLTRVIYVTKLATVVAAMKTTNPLCSCEQQSTIPPPVMGLCWYKWFTLDEIRTRQESLWGTEPVEVLSIARELLIKAQDTNSPAPRWSIHQDEFALEDAMRELVSDVSICDGCYRAERELLYSAQFNQDIVLKLANEYVAQCFPARFMTLVSFRVFMFKLGWFETTDDQTQPLTHKHIFTTFTNVSDPAKCRQVPYLTFNELILGLAALDERADNRGARSCRLRFAYIFHAYDRDQDGKWNYDEVERVAQDVTNKGEPLREFSRNTEAIQRQMTSFMNSSKNEAEEFILNLFKRAKSYTKVPPKATAIISFDELKGAVDKYIDWFATSFECLFRLKSPLMDLSQDGALAKFDFIQAPDKIGLIPALTKFSRYDIRCELCHSAMLGYIHLGAFGVRVDISGAMRGSLHFAMVAAYKDVPFRAQVPIPEAAWNWIIEFMRYVSLLLSEKTTTRPTTNVRFDEVLTRVRETTRAEPAVVRLASPCLVMGDVRSNLQTLYSLVNTLNSWTPFVNVGLSIILCGNFIDQNQPFATDTLVYLLCLKALLPRRVILLRGPFEACARQAQSRLSEQIQAQYGEAAWNDVCDIFDHLPYGAIVDDDCFITKSGIPLAAEPLDSIEALKPPTKQPSESVHLVNMLMGQPLRSIQAVTASSKTVKKKCPTTAGKTDRTKSVLQVKNKAKECSDSGKQKKLVKKKIKCSRPVKSTNSQKSSSKSSKSSSKSTKSTNGKLSTSPTSADSSSSSPASSSQMEELALSAATGGVSPPGFTLAHLKRFLLINRWSRVLRSDMIPLDESRPYRISPDGALITLGGIGRQQQGNGSSSPKLYATVALLNRYKMRLLRLETLLVPFSYL